MIEGNEQPFLHQARLMPASLRLHECMHIATEKFSKSSAEVWFSNSVLRFRDHDMRFCADVLSNSAQLVSTIVDIVICAYFYLCGRFLGEMNS